jgi:hypothetical protein
MALAIEQHPQYPQILDWIAQGVDNPTIAKRLQPPIDQSTIWRFRRKRLVPALQGSAAVVNDLARKGLLRDDIHPEHAMQAIRDASVQSVAADPLRSRILKHMETLDAAIQDARDDKDARGIAALISTDLKGMDLDARLSGRLDAGPKYSTVTFVLMAAQGGQAAPVQAQVTIEPSDASSQADLIEAEPVDEE